MVIKQLPVNSDIANYEFKTDLEGTRYIFTFRFNTRANRWIVDILQDDKTMILSGIPLVLGTDLIGRFQNADLPPGNLFLVNLENEYAECGRNDLGNDVLLMYQESS